MLTEEQAAELRVVVSSRDVPASVATRARIVLWMAEGRRRKDVAELAGVSLPTVDRWVDRYAAAGLAGLADASHAAPREQVPVGCHYSVIRVRPGLLRGAFALVDQATEDRAAFDPFACPVDYRAVGSWSAQAQRPVRSATR